MDLKLIEPNGKDNPHNDDQAKDQIKIPPRMGHHLLEVTQGISQIEVIGFPFWQSKRRKRVENFSRRRIDDPGALHLHGFLRYREIPLKPRFPAQDLPALIEKSHIIDVLFICIEIKDFVGFIILT
jgi:hypothetical protein